jgi:hypothetical protein|tara:strand:- start:152 stop:370 length:219 start_codon:yes stop_codon:yes gene_type:complete
MDTGVSGGRFMISATKVMEPQCSLRMTITGTPTDAFHVHQKRTGFCSWDLLLAFGIGITQKNLVPTGGTEIF